MLTRIIRWSVEHPVVVLSGAAILLGGLYGLLNVLWCLWDSKRQCLHDKLPKTVVVPSR